VFTVSTVNWYMLKLSNHITIDRADASALYVRGENVLNGIIVDFISYITPLLSDEDVQNEFRQSIFCFHS